MSLAAATATIVASESFILLVYFFQLLSSFWFCKTLIELMMSNWQRNLVYIRRVLRHKRALSVSRGVLVLWWCKAPSTKWGPSFRIFANFVFSFLWWWLVARLQSEWVDPERSNFGFIDKCLISHALNTWLACPNIIKTTNKFLLFLVVRPFPL